MNPGGQKAQRGRYTAATDFFHRAGPIDMRSLKQGVRVMETLQETSGRVLPGNPA
jgi:hypothetical protein